MFQNIFNTNSKKKMDLNKGGKKVLIIKGTEQ